MNTKYKVLTSRDTERRVKWSRDDIISVIKRILKEDQSVQCNTKSPHFQLRSLVSARPATRIHHNCRKRKCGEHTQSKDKISEWQQVETHLFPDRTSGEQYSIVPQNESNKSPSFMNAADPKSMSFTWKSSLRMMFSSLCQETRAKNVRFERKS